MLLVFLPQSMLPDEQHFPGFSGETPSVLCEDGQEDDVDQEFHEKQLPKHAPVISSEDQTLLGMKDWRRHLSIIFKHSPPRKNNNNTAKKISPKVIQNSFSPSQLLKEI